LDVFLGIKFDRMVKPQLSENRGCPGSKASGVKPSYTTQPLTTQETGCHRLVPFLTTYLG